MPTDTELDPRVGSFIAPLTGNQIEQIHVDPAPARKKDSSMKKPVIIVGVVLILILIVGGIVMAMNAKKNSSSSSPAPTPVKKRIVIPPNVISVADRPVVYLTPEADGHSVTMQIATVKKAATSADYALDYQTGEMVQGVEGTFALDTLPVKTTQLMGSKSGGGKVTYHENVKGGTFLLKFLGAEEYAVKQDWRYIDNKLKETAFSSTDAKFQLISPDLAKTRYLIIYNSPGYPEGLSGAVVSDPYTLQTSTELKGKAKLTMRAMEEGDLMIAGFDGKAWKEFKGTVDGKMITAEVELMPLYVVVKK